MARHTRGRPDRRHGGTGARHTRRFVAPTRVAPGCKVKPAPGVTGPHRGTRTQKLRASSYLQLRTGRTRQPRASLYRRCRTGRTRQLRTSLYRRCRTGRTRQLRTSLYRRCRTGRTRRTAHQLVPTVSHRPHAATSRQLWSFPAPARRVPGHSALVRVVPERPEGSGSTTTAAKSANHRGEDAGINHNRREPGQPPSEPQGSSCFLSFLVLPLVPRASIRPEARSVEGSTRPEAAGRGLPTTAECSDVGACSDPVYP